MSVVDCGALDNPANGEVFLTNTTFNSVATYSCNTGYNLTGDNMRTCLETGFWSGSDPTCSSKYGDIYIYIHVQSYIHDG